MRSRQPAIGPRRAPRLLSKTNRMPIRVDGLDRLSSENGFVYQAWTATTSGSVGPLPTTRILQTT